MKHKMSDDDILRIRLKDSQDKMLDPATSQRYRIRKINSIRSKVLRDFLIFADGQIENPTFWLSKTPKELAKDTTHSARKIYDFVNALSYILSVKEAGFKKADDRFKELLKTNPKLAIEIWKARIKAGTITRGER